MTYWQSTSSRLDDQFLLAERGFKCLSPRDASERLALKRRLKNNDVVRPIRGMYARATYWNALNPRQQLQHIIRSFSSAHPNWVFSHASAAAMQNLEVPFQLLYPIHYYGGATTSNTSTLLLKYHASKACASIKINGARVTPVEQTVVDCAAQYTFQQALPIADSALHQGLTDKLRLMACLNNRTNRRGVRRAKRVIRLSDPRPDNGGESSVRALMLELNLPVPELQVPISNPEKPGHFYYVDYLFTRPDGVRVAMELDGKGKYQRDALNAMMEERQREAAITSHGIRVVRFSYGQATNQSILLSRLANYGIEPLK